VANEVVIHVRVDKNMTAADMEGTKKTIIERSRAAGKEGGTALGEELVRGSNKVMVGGFADTFREVGAYGNTILIGALAAASPMIGAALSTAIIGGAGGAGIVGGVMLAVRNPAVQGAGKELGKNLLSGLEQDSSSFVQPVLDSIGLIESRFETLRPTIQRIFGNSSQFLGPLVDSSTRAVGSILRGIDSLTDKAEPVMDSLGRTVEITGAAFEKAADIIAGGADDAANSTDQFAESFGSLIVITAGVIRGLTKVSSVIVDMNTEINDAVTFFPKLFGWMDKGGEAADRAAPKVDEVSEAILSSGEAAGKAGMQMQTYGDKMSDAANKGQDLFSSQTNVAEAFRKAEKAIKENGKGLGTNTEKQLDNRKALSQVARELTRSYQAFVTLNGEGKEASRVAASNRDRFVSLAMQFGKTKREAEALADQMGLLKPKKIDFYANTHDAAARLRALQSQVNNLRGKTIRITTVVSRVNASGDEAMHGGARASGGIVGAAASGGARGGLTLVGEYGPELADLPAGTRVHSNPDTMRMLGQGGGGGGVLTVRAVADRTTERGLVDLLFRTLRWEIANQFGGDVQLALGK